MTQGEFRQYLGLAQGSNYEVQAQLLVAGQMKFGSLKGLAKAQELSVEVGKLLGSLIVTLGAKG